MIGETTGQYLDQFPRYREVQHKPRKPHRLDRRPLPWLWIWTGIAIACWLIVAVRVW